MPEYRRARLRGGTFFFTVVTYRRYPIFGEQAAIDLLNRCFKLVMTEYPCKMDAVVILPDHLHCIWTLPDSDLDFSTRWKRLKARFTRDYSGSRAGDISESMHRKKERGIWQRRFWEHKIRDQEDFNRHCDYIHYNPVKHGLVSLPIEWNYSSFRSFVERGFYSEGWGHTVGEELLRMDLE
jgi:putative transposase